MDGAPALRRRSFNLARVLKSERAEVTTSAGVLRALYDALVLMAGAF